MRIVLSSVAMVVFQINTLALNLGGVATSSVVVK